MIPIARNIIPKATTPERASASTLSFMRARSSEKSSLATQSTAPRPQPPSRQPASRKMGSASMITVAAASAGISLLGTGCDVRSSPAIK